MDDASELLEFVILPTFERQSKGLLSDVDIHDIEQVLIENPAAAPVIQGTGGVRKLRFAIGNKGKSGGVRVIYYHRNVKGRVYLLTVYGKSVQDNLTKAQRNAMKQVTAALDRET